MADNLIIASIPKREKVNDVFISSDGSSLDKIKPGSIIGTSSLRRAVQIIRQRSDVTVKPIRGNIETRINKISGEHFDAIVLAHAGISRLGVDVNFTPLSTDDFSPSPGQGAIAIVARTDDLKQLKCSKKLKMLILDWKLRLNDALSDFVDSGCRFPLGAYAKSNETEMTLTVYAFSVDGKQSLQVTKSGDKNNPKLLGKLGW